MNEKDLEQLLSRCKRTLDSRADFSDDARRQSWARIAGELGFSTVESKPARYTLADYLSFVMWKVSTSFVRPVSIAASSFVVVFAGWITTVNASVSSVPGDFLYPVKLATEQIQLSLANDTMRARLHAEFASRRLDEVADIVASTRDGKEVRVREAVESFKAEIASASAGIEQITADNPQEAVEIAKVVDRRVEELTNILAQTEVDPTLAVHQEEVADALVVVEGTQQQVAEVMISKHEDGQKDETEQYLQSTFQKDLIDIQNRMNATSGRLQVIETVLATETLNGEEVYAAQITEAHLTLKTFDGEMVEAMDLFAAGGFRRVSEIVRDLQTRLQTVQNYVTVMEIEISTQMALIAAEVAAEELAETPPAQEEPAPLQEDTQTF